MKKLKFGYKKAFIITAIALFLLGGLNIYAIWATNGGSFTVPKPWTEELAPSYPIEITDVAFKYDIDNNIYTECKVTVLNGGTSSENAEVNVQLKVNNAVVTSLTKTDHTTTAISPGGTDFVTVTWTTAEWSSAGYTVSDLSGATITAYIYVP